MTLALVVWAAAIVAGGILMVAGRDIASDGAGSDARAQIRAAANARMWRWPSDMHKHVGKARMKDVGVLMLVVFQRLLRDREGFFPVVAVSIFAHVVGVGLLFHVAQGYWGAAIGATVALLYLTALSPYIIILQAGYHGVAFMFFLISVLFLQSAGTGSLMADAQWLAAAGVAFGLSQFASASSRKFVPMLLAALLCSQPTVLGGTGMVWQPSAVNVGLISVFALVLVACLIAYQRPHGMTAALERLLVQPAIAKRLGVNRARQRRTEELVPYLRTLFWVTASFALFECVAVLLTDPRIFFPRATLFAGGFLATVVALTWPDVLLNLRGYFWYSQMGVQHGHLKLYRNHFERLGRRVVELTAGRAADGALRWLLGFFLLIMPVHFLLAVLATLIILWNSLSGGGIGSLAGGLAVIVVAASPVIIGELTWGAPIGRAYYPAVPGLLVAIAVGLVELRNAGGPVNLLCVGVVVLSGAWTGYVLTTDVWPARTAVGRLARWLRTSGIKTFHSYDTPYNNAFVQVLLSDYPGEFHCEYIASLDEVRSGVVVVPGTSSKAFNMESESHAIESGDFDDDPVLADALATRRIEQYALARFKTVGTSRIWGLESEAVGYRDLILGEIGDNDRWRAHAWVLDGQRLAGLTAQAHATASTVRERAV